MILDGPCLHSGKLARLTLEAAAGPVVLRGSRGDATLPELEVTRTDRGVRVRCERAGLDVDGVEHLFAALGGLGVRSGVAVSIVGGEVPLADGAAAAFVEALQGLGVATGDTRSTPADAAELWVTRTAELTVGASTYAFAPADAASLDVEIDFGPGPIGVERAAWDGTPAAFVADIAWARTFGFRRDAAALLRAGRAHGADPRFVMIVGDDGRVEPPGAPARPGEFARHKLLDLVGDLYVHGGPPRGHVTAKRPGHAATHEVVKRALREGILRAVWTE